MKLAVIFGGESYEHEISIVSAISLKKSLSLPLVFIFLDKNRDFYFIPPNALKSKLFSSNEYSSYPKLNIKKGGFYQKGLFSENRIDFDYAINLIHGRDGEDGKIASLFDFFEIPYIGPRIEASSISYNKLFTKLYAKEVGVETLEYQVIYKDSQINLSKINYPSILKPLRLGSSIGVSIVREESEFEYARDVAFEFDDGIILEPFIEGVKEYNVAGFLKDTKVQFSIVEEPLKGDYLDFDKKYLDFTRDGKAREAEIEKEIVDGLKEAFCKIYTPLFAGSITRCDFFVIDNRVFLNEINPVPGSMSNYLFEDFEGAIVGISNNLPSQKKVVIDYAYIDKIERAKGK